MSEAKWSVTKWTKNYLRIISRGKEASALALELECATPMTGLAEGVPQRQLAERLAEVLPAHPDVQRFALLQRKKAAIQADQKRAEAEMKRWEAERNLISLRAYEPEQARELAAAEGQYRSHHSTYHSLGGLIRSVDEQLAKARPLAERVLRKSLTAELAKVREHFAGERDRLLDQLCQEAAPALTALAQAVQALSQACAPAQALLPSLTKMLDTIILPASAPADAPPLPPPPPPAAATPQQLQDTSSQGIPHQFTRPADGSSVTLKNPLAKRTEPTPTAPPTPPAALPTQPEPAPTASEGEEARGKRKKAAAARAE